MKMAAHPLLLDHTPAAPQSKKDRYKPMQPKFASIKVLVYYAPMPVLDAIDRPIPAIYQRHRRLLPLSASLNLHLTLTRLALLKTLVLTEHPENVPAGSSDSTLKENMLPSGIN